jgi:hypothetical protein
MSNKEYVLNFLAKKGYEVEYSESKTGKITVIAFVDKDQAKQRSGSLKEIAGGIPGSKFDPEGGTSQGQVIVGSNIVIHLKIKGGSSGSGAGAHVTAIGECGQCYYCAAAWYGDDFSTNTLKTTASYVNATLSLNEVLESISQEYRVVCITKARAIRAYCSEIGNKKVTFHRGSPFVKSIEENYRHINAVQKVFSQINKWSPADIWITTNEGMRQSFNFTTFEAINSFLLKNIKSLDIIPISLKKAE